MRTTPPCNVCGATGDPMTRTHNHPGPHPEVSDVLRVLVDRFGPVDFEVHPEGDTDAVYFEPAR